MGRHVVLIQSHRGAGDLGPENTLESFRLAWEMGTVPEADVRATADGVLVAFHDSNCQRIPTGIPDEWRPLGVEALSWPEVACMDVGLYLGESFRGQKTPSIASVLEEVRASSGRLIYLDIKHAPLPELAALCQAKGALRQCIVASTDYAVIRDWSLVAPGAKTLLWLGGSEEYLSERLRESRAQSFAGISQLQIHVRRPENSSSSAFSPQPDFLRLTGDELRERGILFQAFPMGELGHDPGVYRLLVELGVQSFATDRPDVAVSALRLHS
ncbi:MAG: glycerophosphodiester phosphodiesterase family protein [Armatimonadetes bacterium]|nr:glycerophosphodiester phosphodiesterase family protein [Armatimonadota bacterium]